MVDTEIILTLDSIRQSAVDTLRRKLFLEPWLVGGIGRVYRQLLPPAMEGLRIAKRVRRHYAIPRR
jgi:hypothetical protein